MELRKIKYPHISDNDWNNWRWQIKHSLRSLDQLEEIFPLSLDEKEMIKSRKHRLPIAITPYYAALLHQSSPALRKTVIPVKAETVFSEGECNDPLAEEKLSPVPSIIHRYPDRVVFITTLRCSVYCRYCTRGRAVGQRKSPKLAEWQQGIDYIKANPCIRDILLSGGDPFTLDDHEIAWLLEKLKQIPHVEIVRFGTKTPVTLPQRFTPALLALLKKYPPLIFSLHVTSEEELTPEAIQVCDKLADSGILLGSQTVLLKEVNDSSKQIRSLMLKLLRSRVRPYYLLHCDAVEGTAHFRTTIRKGLEIIEEMRGNISGYAIPKFIVDPVGGGGKIDLSPENILRWEADGILLKNWKGERVFVTENQ